MPKSLVEKAAKGWNPKLQKWKPPATLNIRDLINDLDFAVANGEEVHVVKMYRYLLEPNCLATVVDVVASGAISRFVDFLLRDDAWELQYESA